jgi:hypothetical protein
MKQLFVPFILQDESASINELSNKLDDISKELIANAPWESYPYKPEVAFAMAHGKDAIFLKFYVEEKHLRAVNSEPNEPVYEDSCVEFFISFEDEAEYYNFEFNCAGTCLLGFGKGRDGRELISPEIIKRITSQSTLRPATNAEANIGWELTLVIPFFVFQYHEINSLSDKNCRANFYKCGDKLPEPHFLAWNNIQSKNPNFHLPEFFGRVEFN